MSEKAVGFRQSTLIENALRIAGIEYCKPIGSPTNHDVRFEEVCKVVALLTGEKAHYCSILGNLLYIAT